MEGTRGARGLSQGLADRSVDERRIGARIARPITRDLCFGHVAWRGRRDPRARRGRRTRRKRWKMPRSAARPTRRRRGRRRGWPSHPRSDGRRFGRWRRSGQGRRRRRTNRRRRRRCHLRRGRWWSGGRRVHRGRRAHRRARRYETAGKRSKQLGRSEIELIGARRQTRLCRSVDGAFEPHDRVVFLSLAPKRAPRRQSPRDVFRVVVIRSGKHRVHGTVTRYRQLRPTA